MVPIIVQEVEDTPLGATTGGVESILDQTQASILGAKVDPTPVFTWVGEGEEEEERRIQEGE